METSKDQRYCSDEARWQAILDRTQDADGHFYIAVKTTGIYCRPICPARRPLRANVLFFDDCDAARTAGFRPCLRCRPDEVSSQQRAVAVARRLLESSETAPTLAELGEAVQLSPTHLQRIFKRAVGLSPRQYAAALRVQNLKAGLKEDLPVTEAMYDAGYGSSRALYDSAHNQLGMTPGTYKQRGSGQRIAYAITDSPLGGLLIAATDRGVCALRFGEKEALLQEFKTEFSRAELVEDAAAIAPYSQAALDYLAGRSTRLDYATDVRATAFQERVWAALREIPYGQTRSYSEIARSIGEPNAVRAVARACASNPVAVAVPCHRVVSAGGSLSGYRWGVERKRSLLELERNGKGS